MVFVIGLVFAFIFGAGIGAYFQRREDQKEAVLEGHGHFDPVTGCFAFGASCEAQELDALKLWTSMSSAMLTSRWQTRSRNTRECVL
jgi:hypothetical protein